jgi:ABC-type Fe3+-hydroxamate transport system, periplasmic component
MRKIFCESVGKYLELKDKCERIISFSPAITESLFKMGLGDYVVGVSAFCVRPKEALQKEKVGSYNATNLSKIQSLNPDIIFTTTGYQRDFALKLSEMFTVYAIPLPVTISSVIATCIEAGYVAGYYEQARKLERELLKKVSKIPKLEKEINAYIEIDLGGPTTFGSFSYITNSLSIYGIKNIFSDEHKEWFYPDFNRVLEEDPDVIIYEPKMFRPIDKEAVMKLFMKRGWINLKAVKKGHILVTPGPYDFLAHHGPSFIEEVLPWLINSISELQNIT